MKNEWIPDALEDNNRYQRYITQLIQSAMIQLSFYKYKIIWSLYNKKQMEHSEISFKRYWLLPNSRGKLNDLYEVEAKEFGAGEFGKVFRGRLRGQKEATWRAIKRIPKENAGVKSQFLNEIDIMGSLDHPNIAKLFETFEDDKYIYLVTELCEGGQLFSKIQQQGCLTEEEARGYFYQIMSAISYLHANEVCHRDLKPQNLLFLSKAKNSPLKLTDFGLSTRFSKSKPNSMKTLVGTAFYMAPEVLKGTYDHKSDVWSAGVILYLMIAGCLPFNAETDPEVQQLVKKMQFSFDLPQLQDMTEKSKQLISSMLCDSNKRISADAALRHPWMVQFNLEAPILNIPSLKAFAGYSKLKRLAIAIITSQSSEAQLKGLSDSFKISNYCSTGTLFADELRTALQRQKDRPDAEQINKIVAACDSSKAGKITFTEFAAGNADSALIHDGDMIKLAFDILDHDHDGRISVMDFNNFFIRADFKTDNNTLNNLIQEADANRDGVIDLNEFTAFMQAAPTN